MHTIELKGKIVFDPVDKTNKHKKQNSWKKIAMVIFKRDDMLYYYAWFIKKRYNIILNLPLRGAHVSFINDRIDDLKSHDSWEKVKAKYDGKFVNIKLSTNVRTDGKHWWLIIPNDERFELHDIRKELGLDKPYYGLHMSIGYAVDGRVEEADFIEGVSKCGRMNLKQSEYIHNLIKNKSTY